MKALSRTKCTEKEIACVIYVKALLEPDVLYVERRSNMDWKTKLPVDTPEANEFMNVTEEMIQTFIKKNHDYGNSYFDDLEDEKDLGPARYAIGNKFRRFKQLSLNGDAMVDESIDDTLLDLANYAVMTLVYRRLHKNDLSGNS